MLKAILVGNIGSEPESRFTASGQPLLTFSVASNYRAKNLAGNWDDMTEWIRVTLFGARAERLSTMLHKGQRVYVDGRLEAKPWTDRNGAIRAGLEMIASDVEFMSSRNDSEREPSVPAAHAPRGNAGGPSADLEDLPY
jgi:single-strand DNA-binding protein